MSVLSTVAAPQLTIVVLTSFRNGTFELSLQYDQQVCTIKLLCTLGGLSPAIYVCIRDESDSPAMHLRWSSTPL